MNELSFSWDEKKNKANQRKHHVSFEEAQSVFYDDFDVQFYDGENSETEDRAYQQDRNLLPSELSPHRWTELPESRADKESANRIAERDTPWRHRRHGHGHGGKAAEEMAEVSPDR